MTAATGAVYASGTSYIGLHPHIYFLPSAVEGGYMYMCSIVKYIYIYTIYSIL